VTYKTANIKVITSRSYYSLSFINLIIYGLSAAPMNCHARGVKISDDLL